MKKTEDETTSLISKKHWHTHLVELKLGSWKKHYDFNYRNKIIALTLNHFIKKNELVIHGYLITGSSIFLVAKTDHRSFEEVIERIELHIALLLKKYDNKFSNSISKTDFMLDIEDIFQTVHQPLFKIKPLQNYYLIKLITGIKIEIPYLDPELEYLKLLIKNHPFCSSVDYSGAIGPVEVTLLEV